MGTFEPPPCSQCLIDGQWVGGGDVPVTDPATGEELARVPNLGPEHVEQAIAAASTAFPGWAAYTAKERSRVLRRWFDLVVERAEELAVLLTREQGKPLAEARGEIAYAASFIEFYAEEAKRVYGDVIPGHVRDARIVVRGSRSASLPRSRRGTSRRPW